MWCGVVLNVGVGDMGQKAKPEGCECGKRLSLKAVKAAIQKNILQVSFHCLRALKAHRTGTLDGKSLDGGGGIYPCTD